MKVFARSVRATDLLGATSAGLDVVMLVLPVAGFLLTYLMLCQGAGTAVAATRVRVSAAPRQAAPSGRRLRRH